MCLLVIMNGYVTFWTYANEIFEILFDDDNPIMSPRQAVYIVAVVQLIGALFSLFTVTYFGRKTLLLIGNGLISISLVVIGVSILKDW